MNRVVRQIINLVFAIGAGMTITGCHEVKEPVWTHFCNLPTSGWNVLDGVEFRPFEKDSIPTGEYTAVIAVRHTDAYRYTRLWLELEQATDRGLVTDTVGVKIAAPDGRFLGSGPFGLYEVTDTLPARIKVTPDWQMSVRHVMKENEIEGINNIGLIMIPADAGADRQ